MEKHVAFWLGAFCAAAICVTVAIGAWSVASERALSIVSFAIGGLFASTLLLYLAFGLRKLILRKALGLTEAKLTQVAEHATDTIYAASQGQVQQAHLSSTALAKAFVGWWTWNNFYRWVLRTNVALLIAFGGFVGTVLLFEQNERLSEQTKELIAQRKELQRQGDRFETQNELLGLNLTSNFRDRLSTLAEPSDAMTDAIWVGKNSCQITLDLDGLLGTPNPSAVAAIATLASSKQLSQKVVSALISLTEDRNHAVRLGAILALDRAKKIPENAQFNISGLHIAELKLRSSPSIEIENSFIRAFQCENCKVSTKNSVLGINFTAELDISESIIFGQRQVVFDRNGRISTKKLPHVHLESNNTSSGLILQGIGDNVILQGQFLTGSRFYGLQESTAQHFSALESISIEDGTLVSRNVTCKDYQSTAEKIRWMTFRP